MRVGLPLSAGVTIYVAATDLVPEVNREPGIRMALVFFVGVVVFFLLAAAGAGVRPVVGFGFGRDSSLLLWLFEEQGYGCGVLKDGAG